MRKKIVCGLILIGLAIAVTYAVVLSQNHRSEPEGEFVPVNAEKWATVELSYWMGENEESYINVTKIFPDSSYYNVTWGNPIIEGNNVTVNVESWRWTGGASQLVITLRHTYVLGVLSPGTYTFTFKVWDTPIKNITFTVPE